MNTAVFGFVHGSRKQQTGAVAIECALLIPILLVFLTLPIFWARVFWHYTVVQKAAQDAARYLSTVPRAEMRASTSARAAGQFAKEIIQREMANIAPGIEIVEPDTFCNDEDGEAFSCGSLPSGTVPATVRVQFSVTLFDPFGVVDVGWDGLSISGDYTMRYVGN